MSGKLAPGEKLPSIRGLARTLKINPTTVTRIYNDLAHQGIIVLRQGQGAFVSDQAVKVPEPEVHKIVAEKARAPDGQGVCPDTAPCWIWCKDCQRNEGHQR